MSRIPTATSIETAPPAARPLLEAVGKQLGSVPNMFRIIANSPAGLEGYLGLNAALGKGALDARTRARLALVVAELNGCGYCLAAHTYLGRAVTSSTTRSSARTALRLRRIPRRKPRCASLPSSSKRAGMCRRLTSKR
jgi:AhpD family alkylhydroperoxidase